MSGCASVWASQPNIPSASTTSSLISPEQLDCSQTAVIGDDNFSSIAFDQNHRFIKTIHARQADCIIGTLKKLEISFASRLSLTISLTM
jgi:hypothetical protein